MLGFDSIAEGALCEGPRGGTVYSQSVTANMSWAVGAITKAVSATRTANFSWAASVRKAVDLSNNPIIANASWASSVTKNVGKSVAVASYSFAASLLKNVGKGVTANASWLGIARTLVQNIVDTTNLQKPINYILANQQRYSEKKSEAHYFSPNYQSEGRTPRSGVSKLGGSKPSFTVRTDKKGYD